VSHHGQERADQGKHPNPGGEQFPLHVPEPNVHFVAQTRYLSLQGSLLFPPFADIDLHVRDIALYVSDIRLQSSNSRFLHNIILQHGFHHFSPIEVYPFTGTI